MAEAFVLMFAGVLSGVCFDKAWVIWRRMAARGERPTPFPQSRRYQMSNEDPRDGSYTLTQEPGE
jgi:hypothetical protein